MVLPLTGAGVYSDHVSDESPRFSPRLWFLLTSPELQPLPSLWAHGQINTFASFKIAQQEENGHNRVCRNSLIYYVADGEWYQWFSYLIWAYDVHLVNIFSPSAEHPSPSLWHFAVITAINSEVIIIPPPDPTHRHMLTSLIKYLRGTGNRNKTIHTMHTHGDAHTHLLTARGSKVDWRQPAVTRLMPDATP